MAEHAFDPHIGPERRKIQRENSPPSTLAVCFGARREGSLTLAGPPRNGYAMGEHVIDRISEYHPWV